MMLAALRSARRSALAAASCGASSAARPASSLAAVEADARPGGGGFLANLFSGGGGPGGVPLTEPLPGAPLVVPGPPAAAPPPTQSSSLPNGATIAAEDTPVRGRVEKGRGRRSSPFACRRCLRVHRTWAGRERRRSQGVRLSLFAARVLRWRAGVTLSMRPSSHAPLSLPSLPPQGPTTTLGIYVDSGSVYETPEFTGKSWREWRRERERGSVFLCRGEGARLGDDGAVGEQEKTRVGAPSALSLAPSLGA